MKTKRTSESTGVNRYRVKAGNHREGGRVYPAGSIVESPHDLAKHFPNKFKILKGPKPTRQQRLIEEQDLDDERRRKPRAALIGTDAESEESQKETGDDDEKFDPMQGEDSDVSDLAGAEESDSDDGEDEPPRKKKKKKKHH